MERFEDKINNIFDFSIVEEVKNDDDTITEGVIEKAKEIAKKAVSYGIEKVLPKKWLPFTQGLFAAAKQGPEIVAKFLISADQEMVGAVVSAANSGAAEVIGQSIKEWKESGETIDEGASEAALAGAQEIGGVLSTAAYVGLGVIGIAAAYGLYRVIKAGIEIYQQEQKMSAAKQRKRR